MIRAIASAVSSSDETMKSTSSNRSCQISRYSTFVVLTIVFVSGESIFVNIEDTMFASSREVHAITRSAPMIPAS
jgi:hypothetical protein